MRYFNVDTIAEYKIADITDDKVTFFFNNLANDKEKTYITMPSEKFISYFLIQLCRIFCRTYFLIFAVKEANAPFKFYKIYL